MTELGRWAVRSGATEHFISSDRRIAEMYLLALSKRFPRQRFILFDRLPPLGPPRPAGPDHTDDDINPYAASAGIFKRDADYAAERAWARMIRQEMDEGPVIERVHDGTAPGTLKALTTTCPLCGASVELDSSTGLVADPMKHFRTHTCEWSGLERERITCTACRNRFVVAKGFPPPPHWTGETVCAGGSPGQPDTAPTTPSVSIRAASAGLPGLGKR